MEIILPGTGPGVAVGGVVIVDGLDGCPFVHPARKAVRIRMHAQKIGKTDLFICFSPAAFSFRRTRNTLR
jgi:hypothetical protein